MKDPITLPVLGGHARDPDLYQRVFLRLHALAAGPVVVCTRLAVDGREDGGALAEADLAAGLEGVELRSGSRSGGGGGSKGGGAGSTVEEYNQNNEALRSYNGANTIINS